MTRPGKDLFFSIGLAVTLVVVAGLGAACDRAATDPGTNKPAATNSPTASNAPTNAAAPAAAAGQPPLGMEDTIEGRVVGLICYKENPKATPEQLAACAKNNVEKGGYLGVLGSDGTLYVNPDVDVRINNAQMKDFIGQEVTVQGQNLGDAPDLSWDGVTVKKFKMKLVRRKGPPPAGAEKNIKTTGGPVGGAPPAAPKKP
jgi:hypothetical protein